MVKQENEGKISGDNLLPATVKRGISIKDVPFFVGISSTQMSMFFIFTNFQKIGLLFLLASIIGFVVGYYFEEKPTLF